MQVLGSDQEATAYSNEREIICIQCSTGNTNQSKNKRGFLEVIKGQQKSLMSQILLALAVRV